MKYIKAYEENKNEPKVGDYVIFKLLSYNKNIYNDFINNNIGQVIKLDEHMRLVKYQNVPIEIKKFFNPNGSIYIGNAHSIVDFDESKENLELRLAAKKYNI